MFNSSILVMRIWFISWKFVMNIIGADTAQISSILTDDRESEYFGSGATVATRVSMRRSMFLKQQLQRFKTVGGRRAHVRWPVWVENSTRPLSRNYEGGVQMSTYAKVT